MQTFAPTAERLAAQTIKGKAADLFRATAQQRINDAINTGRDSDVHHGICLALATVGLIEHDEYRALEITIFHLCLAFHEALQANDIPAV